MATNPTWCSVPACMRSAAGRRDWDRWMTCTPGSCSCATIYAQTAAYGHFGRELPDFTWEKTDRADDLRSAAGL